MKKLQLPDSLQAFAAQAARENSGSEPWAAAISAGQYPEALAAVEAGLAQSPDSTRERLWWIYIQLELGRVPLTALASPVMEILPALKADASLHRLSLQILLLLAGRLAEKGQLRLGASVIEAASELAELAQLLSAKESLELHEYSISYLEEELARATSRRENGDYLKRLEKKLEDKRQRKLAPPPAPKSPRPRKNTLSSKRLFEQALAADSPLAPEEALPPESRVEPISQANAPLDERPIEFTSAPAVRPHKSRAPAWILGAVIVILLCTVFTRSLGLLFHSALGTEPGLLLAMNTKEPEIGQLKLPEVSLSRHERLSQKMQTINENLDQVGERLKNMESKSSDGAVDQSALQASDAALNQATKKSEDELVPLDSPRNSSASSSKPSAADMRRTPRLDPSTAGSIKVSDLGVTPPIREQQHEYKVGPDGRLYGPPPEQDASATGTSGGRALDGSPLGPYEVQQYDPPQLYRTIVPTDVLSAPSFISQPVEHLERDASVYVVSKMGQWLELRSPSGRKGYMFAQNAIIVGQ